MPGHPSLFESCQDTHRSFARTPIEYFARTPIADSLAKVESDLKKAPGRKVVIVLVTDGEETCDGKPEEVIQRLQDNGFDVTLNVFGFAVDELALETRFKSWADLGSGRYFSANSQQGLSESIR